MNDASRRIFGLVIGLLIGLAYGLVANLINPFYLPGIPLYYPTVGVTATIVLEALAGGVIGLLAAWPEDVLPGLIISSLVGALLTTLFSLYGRSGGTDYFLSLFVLLVMTFLPRTFLFLPMAAAVRWILSVWSNELQSLSFSIPKLALSVVGIIVLAGLLGTLSLYPAFARQALTQTHALVQAGMQARAPDDLPAVLKDVDGFLQGARGAYTLDLSDNPDLLSVQRPIAAEGGQEYAVFVRFENGFRFGCAFTPTYDDPACGEY